MAKTAGLLSLSMEPRTRIYSYLLPRVTRDCWLGQPLESNEHGEHDQEYWPETDWREDRFKPDAHLHSAYDDDSSENSEFPILQNTTTFMRTCRQIYHEAADYLYAHGRIGVHVNNNSLYLLRRLIQLPAENISYFGALQHVWNLDILITVDYRQHFTEVCESHVLIAQLAQWLKQNRLRSMRIYFDVIMAYDEGYTQDKAFFKRGLFYHKNGECSRQHVAASIMDPLRNVRISQGGEVSIHPGYFELSAFQTLPERLTKGMLTQKAPAMYTAFVPYMQALQDVRKLVYPSYRQQWWTYTDGRHLEVAHQKILCEIIKGNIEKMKARHEKYVSLFCAAIQDPLAFRTSHASAIDDIKGPLTDEQAIVVGRAMARLAKSRPRMLERTDLGVTHVDMAIASWKAAHKSKFMAHLEENSEDWKHERLEYREERKRLARIMGEDVDSDDSDMGISDTEIHSELHEEIHYDDELDYNFLDNEAEDSDGLVWDLWFLGYP